MKARICLSVALSMFLLALSFSCYAQKAKPKQKTQDDYELQLIKQKVKLNQDQLTKIYTRESAVYAQGGMLKITLYISEKGKVADSEVKVTSGKFTSTLIKAVKAKVKDWKFENKQKMIYSFNLRLSKN